MYTCSTIRTLTRATSNFRQAYECEVIVASIFIVDLRRKACLAYACRPKSSSNAFAWIKAQLVRQQYETRSRDHILASANCSYAICSIGTNRSGSERRRLLSSARRSRTNRRRRFQKIRLLFRFARATERANSCASGQLAEEIGFPHR